MGQFAAGAGQYNVETAQARSINAQTAMGVNEYMWESQQVANKNYYRDLANKKKRLNDNWNAMRDRILNNPDTSDIASGDALNAVYDLITNPKVYPKALQIAKQPLPGPMVKQIPFNYAAAGLTYSLADLIGRKNVPTVFEDPSFDKERQIIRPIIDQVRKEASEGGMPKSQTISKLRAELDKARAILERLTQPGTKDRLDGEKFLKAIYGMTRLLESPSYDVFLASVDKIDAVPLRDILMFMHSFNLRFGPSKTPEVREMYSQLYGALSDIRQQLSLSSDALVRAAENGPKQDNRPAEFFGGMDYQHLQPPKNRPTAPPPPPAGQ
jgi:hypothetical protein